MKVKKSIPKDFPILDRLLRLDSTSTSLISKVRFYELASLFDIVSLSEGLSHSEVNSLLKKVSQSAKISIPD